MSANEIREAVARFRQERAEILADEGRTADWQRQQIEGVRQREHRAAQAATRALWGVPDDYGVLQGGELWKRKDVLEAKLRAAKDKAGTKVPADQVMLAVQYVRSKIATAFTVQDVEAAYRQAGRIERRAWQAAGADALIAKFGRNADAHVLGSQLMRDYAADLETPEVLEIEAELDAFYDSADDALGALSEAASAFENGATFLAPGDSLAGTQSKIVRRGRTVWDKAAPTIVFAGDAEPMIFGGSDSTYSPGALT